MHSLQCVWDFIIIFLNALRLATLFKSKTVIHPFDVSHTSVKLYIYICSKMVSFQLVVDVVVDTFYIYLHNTYITSLNGASCSHHHFPQCNCGSMDEDEDDDYGLVEIIV